MVSVEEKNIIIDYRKQGLGYKKIASILNLKREQVRDFCRTKTFQSMFNSTGKIQDVNIIKLYFECSNCGNKQEYKGYKRKYCDKCRADSEKKKEAKKLIKTLIKIAECETCGNKFIKDFHHKRYCSKACKNTVKECEHCGKRYIVKYRSKTAYCSKSCYRATLMLNHFESLKELIEVYNGTIIPLETIEFNNTDIQLKCLSCDHTFKKNMYELINLKRGCPKCSRAYSRGEQMIGEWLQQNDIQYKNQYSFEELKPLRYDFAVMKSGAVVSLIEYDGRQHYESVDCFGGEKEFKLQKERDELKNNFAKEKEIPLIRISYKEKKSINKILNKELLTPPDQR